MHGSEPANGASRLGQVISGRYLIKELIGEGGMGSVYLAEHTHMRKRVALKLLHAEMSNNEEVLARFRREAEAAAHIEHPNVVAATDFGQTGDGGFFLVLEYVEGTSLRDALRAGPMPVVRALHITRQIAFALERAHDAGIVHRDLKPENVMLVKKEEDPDFVKVLDFGIARFEAHAQRDAGQQPLTRLGTILGTPEYMAPEQALGETVTAVSDLYAVGVMLYEMLTGKHPFEADDRMAILSMHLIAPVPRMADRAPSVQVPPAVEGVVRRLLEKDAKARFVNGRALADAIEEAASVSGIALPVVASPHSSRESMPRIAMPTSSQRMLAAPPSGPVSAAQWSREDALAKTSYGEPAPPSPTATTAHGEPLVPIPPQLDFLKKLPKGTLVAIVVGVPILILFLVVTLILAHRSSADPAKGESGDGDKSAGATATAKPKKATPDKIKATAAQGAGALEALAKEYPEDPAVLRQLALTYQEGGQTSDALRSVRALARLDVQAVDNDIAQLVITAASNALTQDDAFSLLEGPLGPRGVDGLLDLATAKNVSHNTRLRASKALLRPEVKANASPAASVLLELRTAKNCEARHDLMERAKEHGDARILPMLKQLKNPRGCGFMGVRDCYPCLRKDDALEEAITAVEARGSK
jgi:eukaryotic-like serine/threonine-protein kinase